MNVSLTRREMDVLRLIANGFRVKSIARELGISCNTVLSHRQHMLEKFDVHNAAHAAHAVYIAMKNGLLV